MDFQGESSNSSHSLKHIEQMLSREDAEDQDLRHDPLALQAMERAFCQALHGKDSPSAAQRLSSGGTKELVNAPSVTNISPLNIEDVLFQFKKGAEEASKLLPRRVNPLVSTGLEIDKNLPPLGKDIPLQAEFNNYTSGSINFLQRDEVTDEKNEDGLSKLFDKLFLAEDQREINIKRALENILSPEAGKKKDQTEVHNAAKRSSHTMGQKMKADEDLPGLLKHCARAFSLDDHEKAVGLLMQIRQRSSPLGDGSQRLAHYFADSLDARLTGTGAHLYACSASKLLQSTAELTKAHDLSQFACPYSLVATYFAYHRIFRLAKKAKKLHIVDFGISTGIRWIVLIRHLSMRPCGPPKLHITGINNPKHDTEVGMVEEVGRCLGKYCELNNVPFEYTGIAQKWETIRVEDLKIAGDEAVAVICLLQLEKVPDVAGEVDDQHTPRNVVLSLFRAINPDIFIHFVSNGSYNKAEFYQRFKKALFHYSSIFDMLDACFSRENEGRQVFERDRLGHELMNIIACEGPDWVERAETYKFWQTQTTEAGFQQLPLDRELVKALCGEMQAYCHKGYMIDEDGHWMLLGWKGRTLFAICCYVVQTSH